VNEGFAIAGAIETRNLSTRAVGDCESACTLAFLAGRERTLARDARLGFHSSWSPVALYDGDDSDIVAHLRHRGVAHDFVRKAGGTAGNFMAWLTIVFVPPRPLAMRCRHARAGTVLNRRVFRRSIP
jgi:hypothetical protein